MINIYTKKYIHIDLLILKKLKDLEKLGYSIKKANSLCFIYTPFLNHINDSIFLCYEYENKLLTDFDETFFELDLMGVDTKSKNFQQKLETILFKHNISIKYYKLFIDLTLLDEKEIIFKIHQLIQTIIEIYALATFLKGER